MLIPRPSEPDVVLPSSACASCTGCARGGPTRPHVALRRDFDAPLLHGTSSADEIFAAFHENDAAAPATYQGGSDGFDEFEIRTDAPVPLIPDLSHRVVLGRHLWIGIEDGLAVVLSDDEHEILDRMLNMATPEEIIRAMISEANVAEDDAWESVTQLLQLLAESGFIRGIAGHHDVRRAEPRRFARLHLTKLCQLECIHCYAESSPRVGTKHELPPERWAQVIDDFAASGGEKILFTGGEALVYKGCIDLMRRAKARGLHVTLFSNGYLIPKYIEDLIGCVDAVQISIDSPHEEMNDRIRGRGSFRKAIDAVLKLLEADVQVRIGMTVMELTWESIKSGFLHFAKQFEGTKLEYRLGYGLSQHGRGEDLDDHLTVEETRPIVDAILRHARPKDEKKITRKTAGCGYAEQLVIAPDGTVYPCHLLDGALCHIDDAPLSEILEVLQGVARDYDVNHSLGCSTCDIRNLCGGTCRVHNGKMKGSRLITTCTQADKEERYRSLVRQFARG